jgi:hypothetical protein
MVVRELMLKCMMQKYRRAMVEEFGMKESEEITEDSMRAYLMWEKEHGSPWEILKLAISACAAYFASAGSADLTQTESFVNWQRAVKRDMKEDRRRSQ